MWKILKRNNTRRTFLKASGMIAGIILLAACDGNPASKTQSAAPTPTPDPDETVAPTIDPKVSTPTEASQTVLLEIGTATGAKEFKYDKQTLEAQAGSKIKLKFTNNTDPKDEVGHNWVLVKPGQEASVIANSIAAGDNSDYLKDGDTGVIAHTGLIEGNQNLTITFDAPPPGTYTYLSTFPDQYAGGMKGTLTIK